VASRLLSAIVPLFHTDIFMRIVAEAETLTMPGRCLLLGAVRPSVQEEGLAGTAAAHRNPTKSQSTSSL